MNDLDQLIHSVPVPSAPVEAESVVVIEDDQEMRELLGMFMVDEGYSVQLMANGEDFLRYLNANQAPKFVLLDLNLPQKSGSEILKILNQREDRSAMKIYVASAWDDIAERARECGADGFIRKPLDLDRLTRALSQCFGPK